MNNASINQCASAKTVIQLDDAEMSHNYWDVVAPRFVTCPTCGHAVKTQRRFWLNKTTGRWSVIIGKHAVKA